MSLETCGTVVGQSKDRVFVRVEHDTCANCHGNCIKIRFPGTLSALGNQPIGSRVVVRASSKNLLLASLLVFGTPVGTTLATAIVWSSWVAVLCTLVLCALFVYAATRLNGFKALLKVHADLA